MRRLAAFRRAGYPAVTFVGTFFQGTHPASYFYPSQVFDVAGDILPFLKA